MMAITITLGMKLITVMIAYWLMFSIEIMAVLWWRSSKNDTGDDGHDEYSNNRNGFEGDSNMSLFLMNPYLLY